MSRTLGTQENGPAAAPPPQQIAAGQASDSSPSAITRVGSGHRSRAYKNRTRRLRTRQTADVLTSGIFNSRGPNPLLPSARPDLRCQSHSVTPSLMIRAR